MSAVTTHVLDAVLGRPAAGVEVRLEHLGAAGAEFVAAGRTDADGRIRELGPEQLPEGTYRLTFSTGRWFAAQERSTFYPEVAVAFAVTDDQSHFHVPLLLSPFAYSTYRGS